MHWIGTVAEDATTDFLFVPIFCLSRVHLHARTRKGAIGSEIHLPTVGLAYTGGLERNAKQIGCPSTTLQFKDYSPTLLPQHK